MTIVARAHAGRGVFVGVASDDSLVSVSRDGVVRRNDSVVGSYDKTIVCASCALGFVALGCKDGSVLLLDDESLHLRTSHQSSNVTVTSLLVTSSPPQLTENLSHASSSVFVVAGYSDGSVRALRWAATNAFQVDR